MADLVRCPNGYVNGHRGAHVGRERRAEAPDVPSDGSIYRARIMIQMQVKPVQKDGAGDHVRLSVTAGLAASKGGWTWGGAEARYCTPNDRLIYTHLPAKRARCFLPAHSECCPRIGAPPIPLPTSHTTSPRAYTLCMDTQESQSAGFGRKLRLRSFCRTSIWAVAWDRPKDRSFRVVCRDVSTARAKLVSRKKSRSQLPKAN